jgi:hypothetical protein
MLFDWAQNEKDRARAAKALQTFHRCGNRSITPNTFLHQKTHYSYYTYRLLGKRYAGFLSPREEKKLELILNYYEGEIITIN